MAALTHYGPLWGTVPETTGNVWWVSPADSYTAGGKSYVASDGNDGNDPRRALRTPAQAISNATADNGDVVMMLPGTHTSASQVALSKAGLAFVGAHPLTRIDRKSTRLNSSHSQISY